MEFAGHESGQQRSEGAGEEFPNGNDSNTQQQAARTVSPNGDSSVTPPAAQALASMNQPGTQEFTVELATDKTEAPPPPLPTDDSNYPPVGGKAEKQRSAITKKSCCCGLEVCRVLTRKYVEYRDVRAGHACIPIPDVKYSVEKNSFLRKRWLECLGFTEDSKQIKGNKDVRISKAHFRVADFNGEKLRRWTPGRHSIHDEDIFMNGKRKETLAIPVVTEDEMKQELLRMKEGKYLRSTQTPEVQHRAEMEQKLSKLMEENDRLKALNERLTTEKDDAVQAGRRMGDTLRREVMLRDKRVTAAENRVKELQGKLQARKDVNVHKLQRDVTARDKKIEQLKEKIAQMKDKSRRPTRAGNRGQSHQQQQQQTSQLILNTQHHQDEQQDEDHHHHHEHQDDEIESQSGEIIEDSGEPAAKRIRANSTLAGAGLVSHLSRNTASSHMPHLHYPGLNQMDHDHLEDNGQE